MSNTPESNPASAKLTVDSIVEPPVRETEVSDLSYELEDKQLALDHQKLINRQLEENIEGRKGWKNRVFVLILVWLLSVVALVACEGFRIDGFHLDDSVVIAYISTTTVNVLTLGYIVANYLFPKQK